MELTPEQQAVLNETREAESPAVFNTLLDAARPEMDRIVREVLGPEQAISTTITEVRDLYLSVSRHKTQLDAVNYGPPRRTFFRDGIRLLVTANLWFGEGARTGAFRVRPIDQVVEASRPWRARLKAYGAQAFVFQPEIADLFGDVNTTGTLEEEQEDMRALIDHVKQHQGELAAVGMPPAFVTEGKSLLDEANGRDLVGVLGLRNREEALYLRNRILTYATLLGREARAAGINACYQDPEARRRFETASFRDALRRLRPKRRGKGNDDDGSGEEASAPQGEAADKPEGGKPAEDTPG